MSKPLSGNESGKMLERFEEEEIVEYKYPDQEDAFEEELKDELKSNRALEVHAADIRAMRAFKNAIPRIKHANPENLDVCLVNPGLDVAITRALRKGDAIAHFTIYTESKAEARRTREKTGILDVHKEDPTKTAPEKKFDIVFVMDDKISPTRKLFKRVVRGGYLVLPVGMANSARANFKFIGVIDKGGVYPSVRPEDEDFWKEREVENDEELKATEATHEDGVVTFAYAREKVKEAFGKETDILENYKKLLNMAKDQNPSLVAMGAHALPCTITRDDKTIELTVRTILPLKKNSADSGNLAIFKKYETV